MKEIALRSHPVLGRSLAVMIEAESAAEPSLPAFSVPQNFDPAKYTPEQICDAVREAGIVGMGGAGFPTSVKIQPDAKVPKHTLIINGCECEPYITCDYRLMLEWTEQIVAGMRLAQRACGASNVFIAIEDNKPKAIEKMNAALEAMGLAGSVRVVPVKTKYPQGGERQLIRAVLNKVVPTGGIPPAIGVVVDNVATAAAIADAVLYGRPLTHRVVTVTGEAITSPGNYYVPLGTSVEALIGHCGGSHGAGCQGYHGRAHDGHRHRRSEHADCQGQRGRDGVDKGASQRRRARPDADNLHPLWPMRPGVPGESQPHPDRARGEK